MHQKPLRIQNGPSGVGQKQSIVLGTTITSSNITETLFYDTNLNVFYDIAGISRCSREPVVLCRQRLCLASMRVPGMFSARQGEPSSVELVISRARVG